MKAIISSKLAEGDSTQDAGLAFLQVGQLAGMSPTQYGRNLLEQAGLKSLEAVKNAFVRDSGTTVTVTDGAGGLSVSTDRPGWVEPFPNFCGCCCSGVVSSGASRRRYRHFFRVISQRITHNYLPGHGPTRYEVSCDGSSRNAH